MPKPAKTRANLRTRHLKATVASGQATLGRHANSPALAEVLVELSNTLDEARSELNSPIIGARQDAGRCR